jgi:hypothetical protein
MVYGRIKFDSPSMPDDFEFVIRTRLGKVTMKYDPCGGTLSRDGKPTTPVLICPRDKVQFDHYLSAIRRPAMAAVIRRATDRMRDRSGKGPD